MMNYNQFLKTQYDFRTEFFEISGMYDFIEIPESLVEFIDSDQFKENEIVKALSADGMHLIQILKRMVEKARVPDDWDVPDLEALSELKAGFEIRGLTGDEYARIAGKTNEELHEIAMDLIGAVSKGRADAVKKYLQFGDIGKRLLFFETAVVSPAMGADKKIEVAAKLNQVFPIDFVNMTNRIVALTGFGQCPAGLQGRSLETHG